jgi:hypothetical protein
MKSHTILAGVAVLFLATGTAHAVGTCEVVDPTGTPLNVRVRPNGKVLFTLRNGAEVVPLEESDDHTWVKVFSSKNTRKEGWVFYNFLDCGDFGNAFRKCRQQGLNDDQCEEKANEANKKAILREKQKSK